MVSIAATTENTLGAILIGNIVAAFLYGMTTLQTYMYFGRCRGDSVPLRSLVAFLWILDTTHTVFVSHAVYTSTVARVGDAAASASPIWSMIAQVVVMGVNDAIIRTIFCHRILILSNRNRWAYGINAVMSFVVFCQMIFVCISALPFNPWPSLSFSTLFYMNMSTDVFADAMICVTMSWLLLREKSSMNFRRTNHVIHTLMLYSVSTGALATLCYLGCLISYAVAPNTSIFLAFITNISKRASQSHDSLCAACQTSQMIRGRTLAVFLNSLLASLNSRETIRAQMAFTGILSLPSPGSQWLGTGSSDGQGREGLSSGELSA
ncbi:hypothetical protein L227DRAFT_358653 [Lentinus tigrinus ALCF2SS1-6]|uniref:DUF6534 domain-containing protein n=1 Tax=Lentinus tigrinus ALCF2SS1-6 TaxID=1328759 RepID=A0A5C2SKN6_9APHY|nr:hypothetical protein L227DRAFT_358653 [Lentinus tigrinus ALCF2SS1-6]